MPEAAEVAHQADFLKKWEGKTITSIQWDERSKFHRQPIPGWKQMVFPVTIKKVFSRGKIIVFDLINIYLTSHLGMTGYYSETKSKHSNIWFTFSTGEKLYFTDMRHFGNFTVSKDLKDIWKKNGPCLLTSALVRYQKLLPDQLNRHQVLINRKNWHKAFQIKTQKKLCDFLLEQDRFAGLGNYNRAEIMYRCRIHPEKKVKDLTKEQIDTLYEKTMEVVYLSYKCKGPKNGYLSGGCLKLAVYGQDHDPNGYPVERYKSKNRMVHYCPKIQKM